MLAQGSALPAASVCAKLTNHVLTLQEAEICLIYSSWWFHTWNWDVMKSFIFSRDGGEFAGEDRCLWEDSSQKLEADETQTGDPSCAAGRWIFISLHLDPLSFYKEDISLPVVVYLLTQDGGFEKYEWCDPYTQTVFSCKLSWSEDEPAGSDSVHRPAVSGSPPAHPASWSLSGAADPGAACFSRFVPSYWPDSGWDTSGHLVLRMAIWNIFTWQ